MNSKTIISAIMAVCLASGGFAVAQGKSDRDDRGHSDKGNHNGQQNRRDYDERRDDRREVRHDERRDHDGRGYQNARRDSRDGWGAGPSHSYYRGGRLPVEYRHRQYYVDDWRGHNLSAPPRGYQWVQTGGDYVLIAIATGIIASIFLSQY
jgi:Ni/Co efflux regulator RcnB